MPRRLIGRRTRILILVLLLLGATGWVIVRNYSFDRGQARAKLPATGDWTIVRLEARGPENHPIALADDLWLLITLRNDSGGTRYVQGIRPGWYMVESFIKGAEGITWERQNVGVDQKLEMLPVPAGAQIEVGRRDTRKHIGRAMLLTFVMARSELDQKGSTILVGDFKIPAPPAPPTK
jgi:hypothetical protein